MQFKKLCDIILKLSSRRPVGQAAKTLASHAGNMGSIPVRVTKERSTPKGVLFFVLWRPVLHRTRRCVATHGFAFCEQADGSSLTRGASKNLRRRRNSRITNHPKGVLFLFFGDPYSIEHIGSHFRHRRNSRITKHPKGVLFHSLTIRTPSNT